MDKNSIKILAIAIMFAGALIVTKPQRGQVTQLNAWEATPLLAQQFSTGDHYQPVYSAPGGAGGFFSWLAGGIMGSYAGRYVAQMFQ